MFALAKRWSLRALLGLTLFCCACYNPRPGLDSVFDPESSSGAPFYFYFILGNTVLYGEPDLNLDIVTYTIYDATDGTTGLTTTGDGDGVVESGETVRMAVIVQNVGKQSIKSMSWSMAGDSVLSLDASASSFEFGDLGVGQYGCLVSGAASSSSTYTDCFQGSNNATYQTNGFLFNVSGTGSSAPRLIVTDDLGNAWEEALVVTVQ